MKFNLIISQAKMFLEKWGDGGYKKYVVNNMDMGVICKNEILKNFFSRFNMTLPNDCIFQPVSIFPTETISFDNNYIIRTYII